LVALVISSFHKSVELRTKVSFSKSGVIALYHQFACQICLIDETAFALSARISIAELPLQHSAYEW